MLLFFILDNDYHQVQQHDAGQWSQKAWCWSSKAWRLWRSCSPRGAAVSSSSPATMLFKAFAAMSSTRFTMLLTWWWSSSSSSSSSFLEFLSLLMFITFLLYLPSLIPTPLQSQCISAKLIAAINMIDNCDLVSGWESHTKYLGDWNMTWLTELILVIFIAFALKASLGSSGMSAPSSGISVS